MATQAQKEAAAYRILMEWMAKAEAVQAAFQEAGIPLPTPLRRFNGDTVESERPAPPAEFVIPPLPYPPKPPQFQQGWIFVHVNALLITNLSLGLLRANEG